MNDTLTKIEKRTAGKVNMYAVFFSVFAKVSFIKKADNLYYPLF